MKKYCKVCDAQIPDGRVKLGYQNTCVEHSSTFKYVGFVAGANKVDYQISIVKDKETAQHMQRLLETRGAI
tara:strand:+ start:233 stop:445 length:213 start_codon:yes stop_codon:yes gene_type:complete